MSKLKKVIISNLILSGATAVGYLIYHKLKKHTGKSKTQTVFDSLSDEAHAKLSTAPYRALASTMIEDITIISNPKAETEKRMKAVDDLKAALDDCVKDSDLDSLTRIYRDSKPSTPVNIGYDQNKVVHFVYLFNSITKMYKGE